MNVFLTPPPLASTKFLCSASISLTHSLTHLLTHSLTHALTRSSSSLSLHFSCTHWFRTAGPVSRGVRVLPGGVAALALPDHRGGRGILAPGAVQVGPHAAPPLSGDLQHGRLLQPGADPGTACRGELHHHRHRLLPRRAAPPGLVVVVLLLLLLLEKERGWCRWWWWWAPDGSPAAVFRLCARRARHQGSRDGDHPRARAGIRRHAVSTQERKRNKNKKESTTQWIDGWMDELMN